MRVKPGLTESTNHDRVFPCHSRLPGTLNLGRIASSILQANVLCQPTIRAPKY